MRETGIADERRAREREVRILREALHPFYKSEEEMKRKLIEVEDRLEATYDEQIRLKDRIVALDDASMALEKKLEETEDTRPKRRRTSRQIPNGVSHDASDSPSRDSAYSSPLGHTLSPPTSSRAISPTGPTLHVAEHDEPRSSGILNLVNLHEPPTFAPTPREPTPREEVRSSGFLEISLAERLAYKFASSPPPRDFATASAPVQAPAPLQHQSIYNLSAPGSGLPMTSSPQMNGASKAASMKSAEVSPTDGAKKRTWDGELRPLDVLANLSAASPMV